MRALPLAAAALLLAGCLGPAPPRPADPAEAWAWDLLPDMAAERTEAAAAVVGGEVWVLGGIFPGPGGAGSRVEVLDLANGTWREGPPLPAPVHHAAALALDRRVVLLGGFAGSPVFAPLATSWVLDTAAAEPAWEPFARLPEPRGAFGAATDGSSVWVFGGVTGAPVYVHPVGDLFLATTAWRLDLATMQWSPMAPLPDPRDHLAAAYLGGRVHAVGGRDLTLDANTGRLDVYDPATDTWSGGPAMPTPRGGLGAAVLGGRVVAVGGEAVEGTFDQAEAFDPGSGTWAALPPMPQARHGVGVASDAQGLYVLAGGPEPAFTYSATAQRLRPAPG